MFRLVFVVLVAALGVQTSFSQQKVAILGTEDDGDEPLRHQELATLTAKLRDIAKNTLPSAEYDIMTEQSIMSFLGSFKEMERVCRSADGCLAKIGRDIEADYIGQARLSRFGKFFAIKVEVYDVVKGTLVGTFTDDSSEDIYGLLAVIDNKAPGMFDKMHRERILAIKLKESEEEAYEENSIDPQIEKESSINAPFWAGIALEAVGAGLIAYGAYKNYDAARSYDNYKAAEQQQDIDSAKSKAKDAESMRNISYAIGAISLAAGIGVHIWF